MAGTVRSTDGVLPKSIQNITKLIENKQVVLVARPVNSGVGVV